MTVYTSNQHSYNYLKLYTTQKELRVKGIFFLHFCKYVFTCVNIIFWGYMTFFHQGNKLVSNQKFFVCFLFVSHQIIILSSVVTILAR